MKAMENLKLLLSMGIEVSLPSLRILLFTRLSQFSCKMSKDLPGLTSC